MASRLALAVLALGVSIRLVRYLLAFPIWGDEAFICLNLAERDWHSLAGPLRFDQVAPVLFLWSASAAYHLLGASELALRLPALLAGVLALLLFPLLARCVQSRRPALLAVGLLAVAYFPIRHAVEVKPYAFDLCAATTLLTLAAVWLRRPRSRTPLVLLVLVAPVALAASYPAAFVAGAVSVALLPTIRRANDPTVCGLYLLYNFLLVVTFVVLFTVVGRQQHASMVASSSGYWDASFPPTALHELPAWLLATHVGPMFAYPFGPLTLLCCLVGVRVLVRTGRQQLLALLLLPFALTFVAALLHKYPYGGSARVAQHLAPSICLLAGLGLSRLVRRRWFGLALLALFLLGLGNIVRDVRRPFKTLGDEQARRLIQEVAVGAERIVVWAAPPRLYPSLEWYLRRLGDRVLWYDELSTVPDDRFLCLRFLTNADPEPEPTLDGFELLSRRRVVLELGPEADATRACEVWEMRRSRSSLAARPRAPERSVEFADLVAGERHKFEADRREQRSDGFRLVLDEGLFDEDVLGEPRLELALGDLLDDVGRLVGVLGIAGDLRLGDLRLGLDHVRRHVLAPAVLGAARRDVHAHFAEYLRIVLRPLDEHHRAAGAVVMHIAAGQPLELLHPGRLEVLAHHHEGVLNAVLDGAGLVADERLGDEFLSALGPLEGDLLGEVVGQGGDGLALGRRRRLTAQLDDAAQGVVAVGADASFGRFARGEVPGLAARLGAEEDDGLFHVAAGFGEGRLALHHRHIGAVAQRLDRSGGNLAHGVCSLSCLWADRE